jgi:hypothetical protein
MSKSGNEISTRDRLPEGTQCLDPEWMDAAILGFSFSSGGGVSVVYSAEACVDLLKRNLVMGTEDASERLALLANGFCGVVPVFVWGLD